jgi:hypothetical protein
MYLNDQLGDCVIATCAHQIEQWTEYVGDPVLITDQDVLTGYEAVGGYVPGDPNTDRGCNIIDALNYWRKTGYGGHKIGAYAAVNLKDYTEILQAINLFGSVYIGVALPMSAASQDKTWEVTKDYPNGDASWGSWGGHAIPIVGYNNDPSSPDHGYMVVSWGRTYSMTFNFFTAYVDEAYAIFSLDWINGVGKAPNGIGINDLVIDLSKIT